MDLLALARFEISDIDTSADPMYFGFQGPNGEWYIMRFFASGAVRYVYGTEAYASAWVDRAVLNYVYFSAAF